MKMVKSLILGSAAGLIAMSGAQAADLPVKAKPVEYVRICSLYGAGFYYIPGTDTCIQLSGYLRVDVLANTNSDDTGNMAGAGAAGNRFTNYITARSRQGLGIDTRTATEYGVVRTFSNLTFSWTTDTYAGQPNGTSIYGPIGTTAAPNNAGSGAVAGGTLGVYYAFIQWAGFTMGKAVSQFSAPFVSYPGGPYFDGLVGGGGTITGVNQLTYTAQFGNGVSASVSAQEQTAYYQAGVANLGAISPVLGTGTALGPFGASDYGGTVAPDFVGTLQVDQAWGSLKGSFAAHDNHAAYYFNPVASISGTELAGHPSDKWGFAVQGAMSLKTPYTGAGDNLNIQFVYTDGATRYNIQDLSQGGAVTRYGSTNLPGAYQSIGFGIAPDSVFATGTSQQLIQTWGMNGGFTHNWDPYWASAIYGGYAAVRYNDVSKVMICGVGGVGGVFRTTLSFTGIAGGPGICNPDYNIGQIGINTRWTPVKNLTFAADLVWQHLDQNMVGTVVTNSPTIGKPAQVYELKDQQNVVLMLRAQRNF